MEHENKIQIFNWAFERGLTPMSYDWKTDSWYMSDGEPYTTTLIMRELANENQN